MRRYNSSLVTGGKRQFLHVTQALTGIHGRCSAARRRSQGGSMKWFSRLLRKAPPSPPTLGERVATLDTGSPELILGTALGSDEEGLRVAAIHKLPDGDALRRLAGLSDMAEDSATAVSAVLGRAAQARVAELIDAGS